MSSFGIIKIALLFISGITSVNKVGKNIAALIFALQRVCKLHVWSKIGVIVSVEEALKTHKALGKVFN